MNILALIMVLVFAYYGAAKLIYSYLAWIIFMIVLSCWSFKKWHVTGIGLSLICFTALFHLNAPYKLFVYGVQRRFNYHLKINPIQIVCDKNLPQHKVIEKAIIASLDNLYNVRPVSLTPPNPPAVIEVVWPKGFGRGVHVIIRDQDLKVIDSHSENANVIIVECLPVRVTIR